MLQRVKETLVSAPMVRQTKCGGSTAGRNSGFARDAPPQRQDRAVTPRQRKLALIGVPVLVIAGALVVWLQGGRHVTTENAFVKADIAQIASEVPGRIIEVRIRDHSAVAAGDVLVRLDPAPYQLGARQGRSRGRFRARRRRAAQGQPARDPGRSQGSREQADVPAGAGQAPARPVRTRRDVGREARADQQRGAGRAGSRRGAAPAHRPRRGGARRQA